MTKYTIRRDIKYQKVLGYGGAFTDAAGINIGTLSQPTQENLMRYRIIHNITSLWYLSGFLTHDTKRGRLFFKGGGAPCVVFFNVLYKPCFFMCTDFFNKNALQYIF